MFSLRVLTNKKFRKYKLKKVYLKKRLKKLFQYSCFYKKKKIYKTKSINLKKKKKVYMKYNSYVFFHKFFESNIKKKLIFFINSFFFIDIIKKKNNIFFNITNFKKDIVFSSSLKTLKILKKKKDMFKKNIIYIFFLNSLKKFFKNFVLEKMFNILPNIYILSDKRQDLLLKKLSRIFLKFVYFSLNLFFTYGSNKHRRFSYGLKKAIKHLRYKRKIKILYINVTYKRSFNGCRLRKLKRV